jgi:hypothetical protein
MSHTLTEVATFDATIVVPDGGDSGANRAGDVELIAQRLANRSRALKAVTDNAAVKNASNTFTAANHFADIDATGISCSGNVIVGSDGTGFCEVHGNLWVLSTAKIQWLGAVQQPYKQLALSKGAGNASSPNANVRHYGAADWLINYAASADGFWHVPIELPSNCQLVNVDVIYDGGASGGAFSFRVVRKPISDWAASPATPSGGTNIITAAATSGVHTASLACGNYTINNAAESYTLSIVFNNGFTGGTIYGARVQFNDVEITNR